MFVFDRVMIVILLIVEGIVCLGRSLFCNFGLNDFRFEFNYKYVYNSLFYYLIIDILRVKDVILCVV